MRAAEMAVFGGYLGHFAELSGDQRTRTLFNETVRGIIGSESLCCTRIAAFSPLLAATPWSERRIRRMVHGDTTKRSTLDADSIIARLQGADAGWIIVDGSALRKPPTPSAWATSGAGCSTSGCSAVRPRACGASRPRPSKRWRRWAPPCSRSPPRSPPSSPPAATRWQHGHHLVGRVHHRDRLVQPGRAQPPGHWYDLAPHRRPRAQAAAERVIRLGKQRQAKLRPVTATIAAVPLVVSYQEEVRTTPAGARHTKAVWLVEVRLDGAHERPWWLLTDRPVTTAAQALEVFRMDCQRWSVADCFTIGQHCLGWVAAGFLYELGLTLDWPEVRLLIRLGGGEERPSRPVGKLVLTRACAACWTIAPPTPSSPTRRADTAACHPASRPCSVAPPSPELPPDVSR